MIIIRPIKRQDLDHFAEFSFESVLGMTNLPRDRDKLLAQILRSEESFLKNVHSPGEEEYYFVLEDLTTGRIGGTCGIFAASEKGFRYCYQVKKIKINSRTSSTPQEMAILKVTPNKFNASEICALYLQPTFRHGGQGRLLSLSRFLFIAGQLKRFRKKIVAEMRGHIDSRQISPFWEGLGRHFCNLSFVEFMTQVELNPEFTSQILPHYPIYVSLLPKETQEAIGRVHDQTKPAYRMLIQEHFSFQNQVDIDEGGPILFATTSQIRSIQKSALIQVELTKQPLSNETEYILGNERLDFRACFGSLQFLSKTKALIHEEAAEALLIKSGDKVRYVTPH